MSATKPDPPLDGPAFTIDENQVHIPAWEVTLPLPPVVPPDVMRDDDKRWADNPATWVPATTLCEVELLGITCATARTYNVRTFSPDGFLLRFADGAQIQFYTTLCKGGVATYGVQHVQDGWARLLKYDRTTMADLLPLVTRLARGEGGAT